MKMNETVWKDVVGMRWMKMVVSRELYLSFVWVKKMHDCKLRFKIPRVINAEMSN